MSLHLNLFEVGGFKDKLGKNIEPLPAVLVDETTAPQRLVALKQKINELQEKRESFHKRQGLAGVGAAVAGGPGIVAGGAGVMRQKQLISDILEEMNGCISQINLLRETFGEIPGWEHAEEQCKINKDAFKKKALSRESLKGEL